MILITGCTGFVGSALVHRLLDLGEDVCGLTRNIHRPKNSSFPNITLYKGSITDSKALEAAMVNIDAVINLVGILVETRQNSFVSAHAEGTKQLVESAQKMGVQRYIQMSSLGTRSQAASRYHQSKWQAEESVRQSTLDYTIFQPSVLFGQGDNFVNQFARMIRQSPLVPILGAGTALMQPLWVEDLVSCIIHALKTSATIGKTYQLGGPQQLTFEEIIDIISHTVAKRRIKVHLPFAILKIQAAILETILPTPPLTRDQLLMAQENNICPGPPIDPLFNLTPVNLEMKISEYL